MFYELPPAGNAVATGASAGAPDLEALFAPHAVVWFDSGASALALAVQAALAADAQGRRRVAIPAYTCPEVVAAVLYAGGEPVPVDLEPETPWLSLEGLETTLADGVAAVVAVDLFGIPERLERLRALCRAAGAVLVEDSAQRFPLGTDDSAWCGDLVVLSFGRGKPVSTLGGGAVIVRQAALREQVEQLGRSLAQSPSRAGRLKVKIHLYNLLRSPHLYWIPTHLPGLGLGETVYRPLRSITAMGSEHRALLPLGIQRYRERPASNEAALHRHLEGLRGLRGFVDLPRALLDGVIPRLSRYPVLFAADLRDRVCDALRRQGLGASLMYRATLPEIAGLEWLAAHGPFPGAVDLARRLVTLPVHDGVGQVDIQRMATVIQGATQAIDHPLR